MNPALLASYREDLKNCKTVEEVAQLQRKVFENVRNADDALVLAIENKKIEIKAQK